MRLFLLSIVLWGLATVHAQTYPAKPVRFILPIAPGTAPDKVTRLIGEKLRDKWGQWDPKNQRAELWSLLNGRKEPGEHFRVFPISNWTEMDVWLYIHQEQLELPELYFTHRRECVLREGMWLAHADCVGLKEGESPQSLQVRFRTIGDMTCTGAVLSEANNIGEIIREIALTEVSERGTRADDFRSSAAMEDRKREGYF